MTLAVLPRGHYERASSISNHGAGRGKVARLRAHRHDAANNKSPRVGSCSRFPFGESSLKFELRIRTLTQGQTPNHLRSDLSFAIFARFREEGIAPLSFRETLKSVSPSGASAEPERIGIGRDQRATMECLSRPDQNVTACEGGAPANEVLGNECLNWMRSPKTRLPNRQRWNQRRLW